MMMFIDALAYPFLLRCRANASMVFGVIIEMGMSGARNSVRFLRARMGISVERFSCNRFPIFSSIN